MNLGKYLYPTDFKENILFRDELMRLCANDPALQKVEKDKFFDCPLYAFNMYFWTYDPREAPYNLPFLTYEFQDEFILTLDDHLERGEDLLVDKSRDMGVSWIVVSAFFRRWCLPTPGNNTLLGSRKEDLVDKKGNLDTLLEKCRYQMYRLPPWILPRNFVPKRHDIHLQLYNPETGTTVQGESTNEHYATGGRYRGILFDEGAKWGELAETAWISAGDSSPCRVVVSTPFGMGNHFSRLRHSNTIKTMSFHWTKHPKKAASAYCDINSKQVRSPWYDSECKRRAATPLAIGQELDIDYVTSGSPAFSLDYVKTIKRQVEAELRSLSPVKINLAQGHLVPTDAGRITIFRHPTKHCQYSIGADVAEGVGLGDFSTAVILNRNTQNIDAVYHARSSPDHFAFELMTLGYLYGGRDGKQGALLAIESNTIGKGTVLRCDEELYPNLYYHVNEHLATKNVTSRLGWLTTRPTKLILVAEIENYLFNAQQFGYFIPINILDELLTFVIKGKSGQMLKYEADDGCHDDLVMALGIALVSSHASPLLPMIQIAKIGPHIMHVKKDPSVHERCMATLKEKNIQRIFDEQVGFHF